MKVFGISFDTPQANRAFADKYGFNFPLLCDVDHRIGLAYGACDSASDRSARRISYLIDKDGRIERAYDKVDARTHPQTVLAEL